MGAAVVGSREREPRAEDIEVARVRLRDREERPWIVALLGANAFVIALSWQGLFRPFWYDESWRAYHITLGSGWLQALKTANAPLAGGWLLIERAASSTLGNVEWALRLPVFAFLPVFSIATYRMLRWWLPRSWAAATAILATLNGTLLAHGLQLKSYLPEAACTSLILCLWLSARERRAAARSTWPMYVGMAACGLVSLPAIFLAAPIAAWDGWTMLRQRQLRLSTVVPVGVMLAVVALHTLLFVAPQSYLDNDPFWNSFRLTGTRMMRVQKAWSAILSFPGFVGTGGLTPPEGRKGSPFWHVPLERQPYVPLRGIVFVGLIAVWGAGVLYARRRRNGDALLVALVGALALQFIASTRGRWPVGFVRTNEFLLPLLYALGAVGLRGVWLSGRRASPIVRRLTITATVAFALTLTGVTLWRDAQLPFYFDTDITLSNIHKVVEKQGPLIEPGDPVIVVTRRGDSSQWLKSYQYYAQLNDRTRLPFDMPARDRLALYKWDVDKVRAFLNAHPTAKRVFEIDYGYEGYVIEIDPAVDRVLREFGFCRGPNTYTRQRLPLITFERC